MSLIKGISWEHPRGYQPLRAASVLWLDQSGVDVQWDVRTLKEFGDLPVEKLIDLYDLIITDHPYMGEAHSNGLLVNLNKYLPADFLNVQAGESVGPSFSSYKYNDSLYALPVDAAAQVSAFRKDLTERIGWGIPAETLLLEDAAKLLPNQYTMAIPMCPTDCWCVFLTLCAQYSTDAFFTEEGIHHETGRWALEQMTGWSSFIHKDSYRMNPVQMLEHMASHDQIIYCPFTFGYTNYSRVGFAEKPVHFCDVPHYMLNRKTSLLGGAGLAVSAKTKNLKACLDFMKYILDPKIQRTVYYFEGGQPGHLSAWKNIECNADCLNFFKNTLYTIEHAYVRPQAPGYNKFQEKAADLLHTVIINNSDHGTLISRLNTLFYKYCHAGI